MISLPRSPKSTEELLQRAARPHDGRLNLIMQALRAGATAEQVHQATKIDPWFVDQLVLILETATMIECAPELTAHVLRTVSGMASPTPRLPPCGTE